MNSSITRTPYENFKLNIDQAVTTTKDLPEFVDFKVEVEGKIFSGHSFILMSFSEFFRCMFKANLKEKQDKMVRLSNIPATTFQLILDTLNTRGDTLTADNIINMWHAVHQLQIAVLIDYCEDYILAHVSVDCLERYKEHADYLHSRRVHAGILKFFMLNFSALRETELFLRLNLEDVIQVIESDELVIGSEDLVLYSVYAWVNYGDVLSAKATAGSVTNQDKVNDRKIHLATLLRCTRYCLATKWCIIKLYQHELTLNDTKVKDILFKASSYKITNYYMRGFWPSTAIHRDCMGLEHVAAYWNVHTGEVTYISLKSNTIFGAPTTLKQKSVWLAVHGDFLYLMTRIGENIVAFKLQENKWIRVLSFKIGDWDKCLCTLSHDDCLYIFTRRKVRRFNTNDQRIKSKAESYTIASPEHAVSFHGNILVFGSLENGSKVEVAAVHCLNTETKTWTMLDNITFSPKDMVSIEDDTDTYILDCGGNLWKLTDSETLGFTFVAKLWDSKLKLTGALLYRKRLHVYVDNVTTTVGVNLNIGQVNLVFSELKFYEKACGSSNLVHHVVGKDQGLVRKTA